MNEEIKSYISAELNLKEIEANVEDLKNNKIRRVFLEVQKTRKVWRENPLSYEEFLTALFNIRKGKKMFFYQGPRLTSEEQAYQEKKTEESSINSDLSYELEGLLYEMYPKHLKKYESLEEEKVKKQKKEAIKVEKEKEVALLEKQAKDYERSKNSRTKNLSSIMDGLKGNR